MVDCLISCVKEVGKYIASECLWPPVKRHINYWWCFSDNIEGLSKEICYLERKWQDIDKKIEEARLLVKSPTPEIQNWSKESTQKLKEAKRIRQGCDDLKAWKIISRYTVGKNAKTMAEDLEKLRNDVISLRNIIANLAPTPSMVSISHEPAMEFESRRRIQEDIMEYLNDNHVSMIAICGPGGVGKTTMAKRIVNAVKNDKLFDEVVMVVVSQQIDMLKIQKEVAELLGLKFSEDTLGARASKLLTRLLDSKRKLIIFDDVWEYFDMRKIGVPFGNSSTSCKIILTSRVKHACKKAQKIVQMEVLTKEEAWTLFKQKAGRCVEGSDLRPIAEDVAAECKGLPVALVTVGEALKDENIHVWSDSLSQLRNSMPRDFPEVIKDVYKPLKLSYDSLKNESLESLFLLCCLFPEDYDIPIELLTLYAIGLGIFKGIRNIEEGRSRTYSFVERLKSRFLLMNGSKHWLEEHHRVKMHDVVRDVAIFIGSEEKDGFLKSLEVPSMDSSSKDSSHDCNWMSTDFSIENTKLPFRLDFPNLRLLMILDSTASVVDANVICFEGMKKLNVLSFSDVHLHSLPPTLGLLKQLRTLHLHECWWLRDISLVGKLKKLEILCIQYCDNIEKLPENICILESLRFLELSYEDYSKTVVVVSAISSLTGLEKLKIDCFDFKWEANGNQSEEKKASLSVLEFPPSLTSLEMLVSEVNFVPQEIPSLPQKLVKYRICSGEFRRSPGDMKHERHIALDLSGCIGVGNWIHQLVRSTQSLELKGDGSNNFNLAEIASLRRLIIIDCSTVKKLVDAIDCKFFPVLEHLELRALEELESIIDGTIPEGSNPFQNLKSLIFHRMPKLGYLWKSLNQNVSLGKLVSISIQYCNNLRSLFSVEIGRSLAQLQHLEIAECWTLEQVFWNEMENSTDASTIEFPFPKLQEMRFEFLFNLEAFSQGVEIVELPRLTKLAIICCPKLGTKIWKLNIKLQELSICDNDAIEEILWGDEIRDEGGHHIIFPELRVLELKRLPRLTTFYKGVESIKFPKLAEMEIGRLERMNSLLPLDSEASHDQHCLHSFCNQKLLNWMKIGDLARTNSEATHDQHCLHFFCNQKVEILGLEILRLSNLLGNINKIWCRCIPKNFFGNLKDLSVYDLVGITNLMSSSIAINLVNLHHLTVKKCPNMVVVIEDEKEVFVMSLFPNLRKLEINDLPELKSFCHWENAFELPSLQEVSIAGCSMMETFTLGSVRAPNLSNLWINGEYVEKKDLNDAIHDHFMTKTQDDNDENKDDDEDEDEEQEFSLRRKKRQMIELKTEQHEQV